MALVRRSSCITDHRTPRGILTIATGPRRYREMAHDLARSLELHSPHLPRAIVADVEDDMTKRWFDIIIPVESGRVDGFHHKLNLHRYSPFRETLFIDSDCLATRNVDCVWDVFHHLDFGLPGGIQFAEDETGYQWCGRTVSELINELDLEFLPILNTGMLFFRQGPLCDAVFERANALYESYDDFGLARFKNSQINDEPLIAIAMAEHGLVPIDDYGRTMVTTVNMEGRLRLNVRTGLCSFMKEGRRASPTILHFASMPWHPIYKRERMRLRVPAIWGASLVVYGTQIAAVVSRKLLRLRQRLSGNR